MACDTSVLQHGTESDGSADCCRYSTIYWATKFTAPKDATICRIDCFLEKQGSPTMNVTVGIWGHDAVNDEPETTDQIDNSDSEAASNFPASGSPDWHSFDSGLSAEIENGETYWVVLVGSTNDNSNYFHWHHDDASVESCKYDTDGAAWDNYTANKSFMFKLFEEAAGSTTLTVQDIEHSHSLDTTTLTQANILSSNDISHSHSLDTTTLIQANIVSPNDIEHSHSLDTTTVDLKYSLTTQDISHTHSLDTTTVEQTHYILDIGDISHTHSLDTTTIDLNYTLTTQDISHTHSLDTTTIVSGGTLSVDDISHSHSLDTTDLTQANILSPNDIEHSHSLDVTTIVSSGILDVQDIEHSHSLDATTLTQANILSPNDIEHSHSLDATTVIETGILGSNDIEHSHALDTTTVEQTHYSLSINDIEHSHALDTTTVGKLLSPNDIEHSHSLDATTIIQTHYILETQDISHNHNLLGDAYKPKYPLLHNDTYVKATTKNAALGVEAHHATDPTLSKTGTLVDVSWLSDGNEKTNQRFHIDLGSAKVIKRIYLENFHSLGLATGYGVKNFTFWGSNNAAAFADLTYANDANWTQLSVDISFWDIHIVGDTSDPQYALVTNDVAYRYYAFKFADNYDTDFGGNDEMGVRHVELQGDRLILTQTYVISPNDIEHTHSLDTTTVAQTTTVSPNDIEHTHSLDATTVTIISVELTVQDIEHSHSLDTTTLIQNYVISPNDIEHSHSLDATSVTTGILDPDDISHTHSLDTTLVVPGGSYLRVFTDGYTKDFYFEGENKDFYFEGNESDNSF